MLVGHMPQLIILLVIAVLVLGPGRLPSVGGAVGKAIRDFKRETSDIGESIKRPSSLPEHEDSRKA